jgi:hypothetical protein
MTLKGPTHLSKNLGDGHIILMLDASTQTWVAYLDLQCRHTVAIIVKLELVFGFDKHSFGLRNPGSDPGMELVDGLVSTAHAVWLETHPREVAGVHHE